MNYIVYFHINPKTHKIFYVGIGKSEKRPYKKQRSQYWKNYVAKYGLPIIKVIHKNLTKEQAIEKEIKLTVKFKI